MKGDCTEKAGGRESRGNYGSGVDAVTITNPFGAAVGVGARSATSADECVTGPSAVTPCSRPLPVAVAAGASGSADGCSRVVGRG
jgi:hypothetical protein